MAVERLGVGTNATGMHYSPAIRAGDFIYVSGQIAVDASGKFVGGDIEQQTRQVFANIERLLTHFGCNLGHVVKTTAWLASLEDFAVYNDLFAVYFPTDPPARSTVESRIIRDALIEIEAIAYCLQK